ncbi:MAG: hypothetical protein WCG93_08180 [Paludibacter sp.]
MKHIKKTAYSLTQFILLGVIIGLSACNTVDEVTVIVPKTLAEYKTQMTEFVASERASVDSCKPSYNKGCYSPIPNATTPFPGTLGAYLAALKTDSAIINKPDVTIEELVAANQAMSLAGKTFWLGCFISDRRSLNDSIVAADALNAKTLAGGGLGTVLTDVKTTFTAAVAAAKVVREKTTALDRQVTDANVNLNLAKKVFIAAIIPATIEEYITKSNSYIAAEKLIVDNSLGGYNIGAYNPIAKTNYTKVLHDADSIINKPSVTFNIVSAAMTTLIVPKKAFIPNVADKTTLNETIVSAETLNTATIVGTITGQVSQAVKTTFTSAITTAKTVRELATSTDGAVKAANYALAEARKLFEASIPLNYAIAQAETLNAATLVGTTSGKVSQTVKTTFTTAITTAKSTRDTRTSTVAQMAAAITTLENAKTVFVAAIIP